MYDKAFLFLSWVEKQEFRLVYIYGKGNERRNERGKEMREGKLSDCLPLIIFNVFIIFYLQYNV